MLGLRARGSNDSTEKRKQLPFDEDPFARCDSCDRPVAGCITETHPGEDMGDGADLPGAAIILTCGHVLCVSCKEACGTTSIRCDIKRVMVVCSICHLPGGAILLPNSSDCNLSSCQAPYCTGDSLSGPQARCATCQRHMCINCIDIHEQKFPDHRTEPRPTRLINTNRPYSGCMMHSEPIVARCKCGDLICARCPYNFETKLPDRRLIHNRIDIADVNVDLEDRVFDTVKILSQLKTMRTLTLSKMEQLTDIVDDVNNEVCIMMNQIILQTIQRCWDVMGTVKRLTESHYEDLEEQIKRIDRAERQISMGVEIDERSRDREVLYTDNVSQLMRHTMYALCEPAFEQLVDVQALHDTLDSVQYVLDVTGTDTTHVLDSIREWGGTIRTNISNLRPETTNHKVDETERMPVMSLTADTLLDIDPSADIIGDKIPLRVHSALELFSDLYDRRFMNGTQALKEYKKGLKKRPFQIGILPSGTVEVSEKELEERVAYETTALSRSGIFLSEPRIYGGLRKIHNLVKLVKPSQQVIIDTYRRTPVQPPIWTPRTLDLAALAANKASKSTATSVQLRPSPMAKGGRTVTIVRRGDSNNATVIVKRNPVGTPSRGPITIVRAQRPVIAGGAKPISISSRPLATNTINVSPGDSSKAPITLKTGLDRVIKEEVPDQDLFEVDAGNKVKEEPLDEGYEQSTGQPFQSQITRKRPMDSTNPQFFRPPLTDEERTWRKQLQARRLPEHQINQLILKRRIQRQRSGLQVSYRPMRPDQQFPIVRPILSTPGSRGLTQYRVDPSRRLLSTGHVSSGTVAGNKPIYVATRGVDAGVRLSSQSGEGVASMFTTRPRPMHNNSYIAEDGEIRPLPHPTMRGRGRPLKDDVTAPSYRRVHTGEWPPRRQDMIQPVDEEYSDEEEAGIRRDHEDDDDDEAPMTEEQLKAREAEMERNGEEVPLFADSMVKDEDGDEDDYGEYRPANNIARVVAKATKYANRSYERDRRMADTRDGCFVCNLLRQHQKKPRTFQCSECVARGRPLTPEREPGDTESAPPPKKHRASSEGGRASSLSPAITSRRSIRDTGATHNISVDHESTTPVPVDEHDEQHGVVKRSGRTLKLPTRYRDHQVALIPGRRSPSEERSARKSSVEAPASRATKRSIAASSKADTPDADDDEDEDTAKAPRRSSRLVS